MNKLSGTTEKIPLSIAKPVGQFSTQDFAEMWDRDFWKSGQLADGESAFM
jgi:hypothetical protein